MDMEARRKLILKAFDDHSTLDGMAEEVALAWEEDASEAFSRGVAVGAESVTRSSDPFTWRETWVTER